jgi:hypothetical protein
MSSIAKFSPSTVAEFKQDHVQSLLRRAEWTQVTLEHDYVHPDSFIAREAAHRGYCNVVTVEGCTCPEYRECDACPHHSLLLHRLATDTVSFDVQRARYTFEFHEARQMSLLRRANNAGMTIERDHVHSDSFVAREPAEVGFCQIVTLRGCTCSEFKEFKACPHYSLLLHVLHTNTVRQFSDAA